MANSDAKDHLSDENLASKSIEIKRAEAKLTFATPPARSPSSSLILASDEVDSGARSAMTAQQMREASKRRNSMTTIMHDMASRLDRHVKSVSKLTLKVNDTETDLTASEDATSFGSNSSLRTGTSPLKDKQKSFGLLSTSPKPPVSLRSALACLHDENEADETGVCQTGKKGHRRGAGDECSGGGGGSADNLDRESCNRLRKPSRFDLSASSSSSVSILLLLFLLANSSKFQLISLSSCSRGRSSLFLISSWELGKIN